MRDSWEGTPEISALLSLIVHPAVAAALGALLGVGLMVVSARAVRFVTPADPFGGVVVVGLLMGARFLVVLAALAAFYFFFPAGLAPFGVALAFAFVLGLLFEALRSFRPHSNTSV